MNPLETRPDLRAKVYTLFWVVGLALGATQVGYGAADTGSPSWLLVAMAVYAFLGGAVGYQAKKNVNPA